MRRAALLAAVAAALVAAGLLAALVPAGSAEPQDTTVSTDTGVSTTVPAPATTGATTSTTVPVTSTTAPTTTAPTTTAPTTTAPKPKPRPKPRPKPPAPPVLLPGGVTIGGIHVGGLSPRAASTVVRVAFQAPLVLAIGAHRVPVAPASLHAVAYVKAAVARARAARRGTAIPLAVSVPGGMIRALVSSLAARFDRPAVDSKLLLRALRPFVTASEPGKAVDRRGAFTAILQALRRNERTRIALPFEDVPAKVTRSTIGPVIVIHRGSNRLYLYDGMKPWRAFAVATGQSVYPTPLGRFQIVVKWANPWWYPPSSQWAKGQKPIPPGPDNPLGTRWMGLSAPGVGIHGTPDPASVGYSVSHGCIRMLIPEAEWLFDHVRVGTPVYIVPA